MFFVESDDWKPDESDARVERPWKKVIYVKNWAESGRNKWKIIKAEKIEIKCVPIPQFVASSLTSSDANAFRGPNSVKIIHAVCGLVAKDKANNPKKLQGKVFQAKPQRNECLQWLPATLGEFKSLSLVWRGVNTSDTLQQEKFPDSDLSAAWIEDVKLSLARHREKIVELSKELQQETLYVEYLERLLGEVERYRDSGSDPALLFDAATPTIGSPNRTSVNEKSGPAADNKDTDEVRRRCSPCDFVGDVIPSYANFYWL